MKTPTPFVSDGLVIFAGGYRGRPLFAIKAGAQGDVSVPENAKSGPFLAWRTEPGGPYTTTPLAYRDLLYAVRDEGVLGVYDLKTGALVYRERTGTTHSASPVASDGKVYLAGEDGQLLVLRAGRSLRAPHPDRHGRDGVRDAGHLAGNDVRPHARAPLRDLNRGPGCGDSLGARRLHYFWIVAQNVSRIPS